MCVCVREGVIKPRGSYHLQAQAQQRLVHDQEEDESFFVVVSFGVPAVVADQLVQGGIRDANPFPISIVSKGGGEWQGRQGHPRLVLCACVLSLHSPPPTATGREGPEGRSDVRK